jgi:Zn-dependent protease
MFDLNINELMQGVAVGAIPILLAITLHEAAHAWVASKCGDPTAKMLGRLSLNPIKHIDPVGTVVVPLLLWFTGGVLFGWAKPVPIGYRNLRKPKRDMVLVAIAGPGANFLMALAWGVVFKSVYLLGLSQGTLGEFLLSMAKIGLLINILLAAFNLLPIPPLDGGRVLRGLVSETFGKYLDRIEPFGLIIIVLLLISGLLWTLVRPLFGLVESLVTFLVGL